MRDGEDGAALLLASGDPPEADQAGRSVGPAPRPRERYRQYRSMALEDAPLLRISPQRINTWGLDTP